MERAHRIARDRRYAFNAYRLFSACIGMTTLRLRVDGGTMAPTGGRYCGRCGSLLAADQRGSRCSPCTRSMCPAPDPPRPPVEFWDRDDVRAALAAQHIGRLITAYRRGLDPVITQSQMAAWLGVGQSQVSRIEHSAHPCRDLDKLTRWAAAMHVPHDLLWFRPTEQAGEASTVVTSAPTLDSGDTDEGSDVDRRNLLRLAGAAVVTAGSELLNDAPWQRLADAVRRQRPADRVTVNLLEERTADFFRTEETTPARHLLTPLAAHLRTLRTLITHTTDDELRQRLLISVGESEAMAGWFLFDLQRPTEAISRWRVALELARETGDGPLTSCVLGYWSYATSNRGDRAQSLRLLDEAMHHVRGSAPTTQAWIAARAAEEHAALGDESKALRSLERAFTAYDYARPTTERAWTAFFTAGRLGSLTVASYGRLRHPETDTAARSLFSTVSPTETKVRAIVLAELAATAARHGDYDRADELSRLALPLAARTETSLAVDRLWDMVETLSTSDDTVAIGLRERLTEALVSG